MSILVSIVIGLAIPPVFLLIVQFLVGDPNMLKDAWECRRRPFKRKPSEESL